MEELRTERLNRVQTLLSKGHRHGAASGIPEDSVGIAYSSDVNTVIRAGWGIFYNQDIGNAYFDLARNIAGRVTQTSTTGVPSLFYSNSVPGGTTALAHVPSPYAYSMSPDHRTTYVMQYLFNVQRQLTQNWALRPAIWAAGAVICRVSRTSIRRFPVPWAASNRRCRIPASATFNTCRMATSAITTRSA